MSQLICCDCWDTVNYFINFKTKCITSESIMKNAILNIVKDDPDGMIPNENSLHFEIKPEPKEESISSATLDNIYNDGFDSSEPSEIPLFSISNIASETNEPRRTLRKRKIKVPVVIENVKQKRPNEKKNNLKIEPETENNVKQISTSKKTKIKRKSKVKKAAKLKQMCGVCEASFDEFKELSKHLEGHKKDFMCKLCQEKFIEWPELLSHRLKHTPENDRRCHLCDKYCASSLNMEFHYRKMHYDGSLKLKCNQCDHSFDSPQSLKKHKWSVHSKKRFICDECGKQCNTKSKIKTHVLVHTTVKPHACKLCEYSSKYVTGLREHILRRHTASRVYCKSCSSVFPFQERLDQHVCRQKSKLCPICGVNMPNASMMYRHLKIHREGKAYKCDLCGTSYVSKAALQAHLDKHEGNRTKQCEFCPAKFYYASVLQKHRRIHTGERPYVCKTCGRSFTSNSNLKVHRQIHGEYLIIKKVKHEDTNDYNKQLMILK